MRSRVHRSPRAAAFLASISHRIAGSTWLANNRRTLVLLLTACVFTSSLWFHFSVPGVDPALAALPPIPRPDLHNGVYQPASVERYVVEHSQDLGYGQAGWVSGCDLWQRDDLSISESLETYLQQLTEYNRRLETFQTPVPDVRQHIHDNDQNSHVICDSLELHPDGLTGIFSGKDQAQLSKTVSGYVEPLLPPMRHPVYCAPDHSKLLDLTYLVHDFARMCRKLKPTSRTVLIDMGASLSFHSAEANKPQAKSAPPQPAVYLIDLYRKFGIPFDHIYAFEVTRTDPVFVYKAVPDDLLSAYHWINVPVDAGPNSKMNPLNWILNNFNADDLIIVKLDIDSPSVELPLALQLLTDERYHQSNDGGAPLIDQFYFEHHVHLKELMPYWKKGAHGTVQDSLNLFAGLRSKGIPAHFWV